MEKRLYRRMPGKSTKAELQPIPEQHFRTARSICISLPRWRSELRGTTSTLFSVRMPRSARQWGAASTGQDYAIFLQSLLNGSLIANGREWLRDRTASIPFLFRPRGIEENGDWHYALGAWLECDEPKFSPACADARIYSSPGSFGWTPWIDFRNGYFGLIARKGERFSTPVAVQLEQTLQPLIEEALARTEAFG